MGTVRVPEKSCLNYCVPWGRMLLRVRCGKSVDKSALRRLQNIDLLIAHEIEVGAEQTVQRRRRAFLWRAIHRRVDRVKEQQTEKMRRRPIPAKPYVIFSLFADR